MESASNSGTRVGYTQVSAVAQTLDQQNAALAPAAGRMVIGVLASMAEFERELIKERTALKRAVSRANGTKFGRRRKVADPGHIATARRMKADGHTARDVAKYLGVSRATLYRYLADEAA